MVIASIGPQVLFVLSTGLNFSYFQQVRVSFPDEIQKAIKHGLLKISCVDGKPRQVSLKLFYPN